MKLGSLAFLAVSLAAPAGAAFAAAPARPPAPHVIIIDKMLFGPAPQGLKVGDVVEWRNADIFDHTATAANGAFDLNIKHGASASTTLKAPGVILVRCRFHPGMTQKLTVAAAAPAPAKPAPAAPRPGTRRK